MLYFKISQKGTSIYYSYIPLLKQSIYLHPIIYESTNGSKNNIALSKMLAREELTFKTEFI
jgi:hypothetical protein